jgi:hypothetical protein
MSTSKDNSPAMVRVAMECTTAVISAFTVAPAVSIVDRAIVSNASGKEALVPCLINGVKELVLKPGYFLRQPAFLMIWGVYSGTYCAANSIDALCERAGKSSTTPKFFGSAATNVTLSVLKDKAFARLFGVGEARPLPLRSYGLFATRDSMTILASFTLPGPIGRSMEKSFGLPHQTADNLAQLAAPCFMQFLSAPLHLHGLDLYNRGVATQAERVSFVKQEYLKTALARIARIFPAFGVGGVVNKYIRKGGRDFLVKSY